MRNLRLDMALPDFSSLSRNLVWTLLTNKFQGILSTSQRAKEVVRKAAEDFATLAIIGADPTFTAVFGDTTSLAAAWFWPRHGRVAHSSTSPSTTGWGSHFRCGFRTVSL
jgi:hypothetical protein